MHVAITTHQVLCFLSLSLTETMSFNLFSPPMLSLHSCNCAETVIPNSIFYSILLNYLLNFLTHNKLHLVLKDSFMSTILTDDVAWCRHKPTKRSRIRHHIHNRHTVYITTFMLLYGVRKKRPAWQSKSSWLLTLDYLCIPHQSLRALMNPTELHPLLHSNADAIFTFAKLFSEF